MKKRKLPLRKCIVCGQKRIKKDLIRVVKNKEKGIMVDSTGRISGRGAYICNNTDCLDNLEKNKKLSKILETEIPEEIYDDLAYIISKKDNEH